MCGRYRLSRRKQIIEEHFDGVSREEDWSPRYNIHELGHYFGLDENQLKDV